MAKKRALPGENYEKIIAFRQDLFGKLRARKITHEDIANSSFQFLLQNKIKPVAKAHDLESVLLNYCYWQIQIERRIAIERRMQEYGCGGEADYRRIAEVYIKRRDQMVRRLLWELEQPYNAVLLIFEDMVEIKLSTGLVLYSSKESLDKIKFLVPHMGPSCQPEYIPLIQFQIDIN